MATRDRRPTRHDLGPPAMVDEYVAHQIKLKRQRVRERAARSRERARTGLSAVRPPAESFRQRVRRLVSRLTGRQRPSAAGGRGVPHPARVYPPARMPRAAQRRTTGRRKVVA